MNRTGTWLQHFTNLKKSSRRYHSRCRAKLYTWRWPFRPGHKNSVAFSPQANHIDRATATCRRNLVPNFADRWVSRCQRGWFPAVVNHSFLDRNVCCIENKIMLTSNEFEQRRKKVIRKVIITSASWRDWKTKDNSGFCNEIHGRSKRMCYDYSCHVDCV
jgi:hypothetical protein